MHCDTFTALIDEAKTQREPNVGASDSLSIENSNFNPYYNRPESDVKLWADRFVSFAMMVFGEHEARLRALEGRQ